MAGGPAGVTATGVDVDVGGDVELVEVEPLAPLGWPVDGERDGAVVVWVERAAVREGGVELLSDASNATAAATTRAATTATARINQRSRPAELLSSAGRGAGSTVGGCGGVRAGRVGAGGGAEEERGGAPADSRARRTALSMAPRARRPGVPGGGSVACSSAIRPSDGYVPRTTASIHGIASWAVDQETVMPSDLISRPRPLRPQQTPVGETNPSVGVAAAMAPLLAHFFGGAIPVRFEFWDGTSLGPAAGDTLQVRSPDAVRRLLWAPGELGLARAFVVGDLAFEGDIFEILAALHRACPGAHPCRVTAAVAGAAGGPPARGHRQAAPAATRGGGAAGPPALARVATRRPSSTTTTSATSSMPWCSGRP